MVGDMEKVLEVHWSWVLVGHNGSQEYVYKIISFKVLYYDLVHAI